MIEPYYDEDFFYVPERAVWDDFCEAFPADEDFDLESAENVLDDILFFEVGE